ncbi:MAG: DUF4302 domain-containing protein [Paludibacteraceae bacterium]|nr:DUF4302 domain-containing protein [Paludibacteraceae bacterium]
MQKNLIIYLFLIIGLAMVSCKREEDNLFGQSAAERKQQVKAAVIEQLTHATNGWEMLYFPTKEQAGYAFLMSFNADGTAVIAAKNDVSCIGHLYKEEMSLWDMDFTQSVTLTFNSFNPLLHAFSDPQDDGIGYSGDYEFVVMEPRTADRLIFKGKKTNTYIYLNRFPEGNDWEDYFQKIDDYNWITLCGNNDGELIENDDEYLYRGGDSIFTMTLKNGVFTYKNPNDKPLGIIFTPTGIHFNQSTPNSLGIDAVDFILNEDSSRLVCKADPSIFFVPKYVGVGYYQQKISNGKVRWTIFDEYTDTDTKNALNNIVKDMDDNGANISRFALTQLRSGKDSMIVLLIDYSVEGYLQQSALVLEQQIDTEHNTVTYTLPETPLGVNMQPLIDRDENIINRLAAIFCDTFTIQTHISNINQTQLLLVSSSKEGKQLQIVASPTL